MSAPTTPLMAHATAAWLVDNTALTFEQIAIFCGLHILEIQAIADDTAATKLTGRDPIPPDEGGSSLRNTLRFNEIRRRSCSSGRPASARRVA